MAGEGNGFGGSYRFAEEHDVFYGRGHLAPMKNPRRLPNILIFTGLAMVAVAIIFMPVATFTARGLAGNVAYFDIDWADASGLEGILHFGATRWIGLALALGCLAICAKRISDDAVNLASTICGLAGAAYLGLATFLVHSEVLDMAAAASDLDLDVAIGVWVALAGAGVVAIASLMAYVRRPRPLPDPEEPGFEPAPPPP